MNKLRTAVAAAALGSLVVLGWPGAAAPQDRPGGPDAYTVVVRDEGCELATVDLLAGVVSDLPAAPSAEACVTDLAADAGGHVYGMGPSPVALVRFSEDGTPTATPIVVPDAGSVRLMQGGITFAPDGRIFAHLSADDPGCDSGLALPQPAATPAYAGDSECLYTVDPASGIATFVGVPAPGTSPANARYFGLTWCEGLISVESLRAFNGWVAQDPSSGVVSPIGGMQSFPAGYDCRTGSTGPLWGLVLPNTYFPLESATPGLSVATIDPLTGSTRVIAPVVETEVSLIGLAVVADVALPPVPPTAEATAAEAAESEPSFTG
jgi:hypothetical protein